MTRCRWKLSIPTFEKSCWWYKVGRDRHLGRATACNKNIHMADVLYWSSTPLACQCLMFHVAHRGLSQLFVIPPFPFRFVCQCALLQTVFEKFADYRFKRIVCVDEESRCKGIISVSDLLAYFLWSSLRVRCSVSLQHLCVWTWIVCLFFSFFFFGKHSHKGGGGSGIDEVAREETRVVSN